MVGVRACVRAYVRTVSCAYVRACVRAYVRAFVRVFGSIHFALASFYAECPHKRII